MSVAYKVPISRRPFISGLLSVLGLAGIAALEGPRLFPKLFERRYPRTPFDDLFAALADRENAVRLGAALANSAPRRLDARILAARLRSKIGGHSLALAIADDVAQGRLIEAEGWLVPESLAELCVLAAITERTGVTT